MLCTRRVLRSICFVRSLCFSFETSLANTGIFSDSVDVWNRENVKRNVEFFSSGWFSLRQWRLDMLSCRSKYAENWPNLRLMSSVSIKMKESGDVIQFNLDQVQGSKDSQKRGKVSKKVKRDELRFYRIKARRKMNSSNPGVRIQYRLDKAKRKKAWLIEKLSKIEVPIVPAAEYDPELLTEEEKHYLKRTGEKKKNYILVGRRGLFGGVVLNMHLHWKKHETVKVICRPCKPGQIHEYAEELTRLSKGIVIDVKPNNTIIFFRGKNYVQPEVMLPSHTLSKNKALKKYKYEQSLEHTSQFIEKLEKEFEEYRNHTSLYKHKRVDVSNSLEHT